MSLIILPEQIQQHKAFHVVGVKKYSTKTGQSDYLPPLFVAAIALRQAQAQHCDEIVVSPEGLRPRRYRVADIEEKVRQNPSKFRGLVPQPPKTKAEALYRRVTAAYRQRTKTGLFIRDN